jgi:lipopolysaccharide/colanic/teichoic acid biosynthesis glycosyltransferase
MILDAEKNTGPILALERDPRITTIGQFLRAARLDELPQSFNVLKGDMSLIGPRPERPFFIEQFMKSIPGYGYRMAVRPGITGLAQVLGTYHTSVEEKLRIDLMYVRNHSFLLDLKILVQTLSVIFIKEQFKGVQVENLRESKEA